MQLKSSLGELQHQLPGCLSVALVDGSTGLVVAERSERGRGREGREDVELAASAIGPMLEGPGEAVMRALLRSGAAREVERHMLQELVVASDDRLFVFMRTRHDPDLMLVVICHASAKVGRVLALARLSLEDVALVS